MNYREPERRAALAGEYVLGTLRGRARRRFEKLVDSDRLLRAEVMVWESLLYPLVDAVPEQAPPERLWLDLDRRLRPATPPADSRRRRALSLWRLGAIAATACSVALAILLFALLQREPPMRYVTVLTDRDARAAWMVSADTARGMIASQSLQPQALAAGRSFELWILPRDGAPISLGLLLPEGDATHPISPAILQALPDASGLAVSVEPRGGSPTGQPTGPVLYTGAVRAL